MRLAKAGILLGGCYLAVIYIDPAGGTDGTNERVKHVVDAVVANRIDKPLELTRVEVMRIERSSMVERLRVSGELQPIERVVIRAKAGGSIRDVSVREGQAIKTGDVLVRFETENLQSALKQRESDRDAAHAEMLLAMQTQNRIEQLVVKHVATQEQLDKAESDVAATTSRTRSLSAQTDLARTALRDAEVLAPFDGVIASRSVEPGSTVSADAELLTVVDTSALEAKVLVSTRDVPRVAVGQSVELQIDGLADHPIAGEVVRINPVADNGTRSVPIYLQLANQDGRLWGGMFATGSILIRESHDAVVVPATSLRKDETGDYVLKLVKGRLLRQPVTIGAKWSGGSTLEIADGVADGDTIVTAPLPELRPDTAVSISKAG
jgi:membrane fusion protein (multidrug efflux system)